MVGNYDCVNLVNIASNKRMSSIIKKLFACLMWIVSMMYTYSLSERLRGYRDAFYTMWIRNFVGHVGKYTRIEKMCRLEGDGLDKVFIGEDVVVHSNCVIGCRKHYGKQSFNPTIIIGNNCNIGEYNHFSAINRIELGEGVLTGRYVLITDNSHGGLSKYESCIPPSNRTLKCKGPVLIGKNVWIGDKVTILSGVCIGDNVIVAANATVTNSIPSNCVVAGSPAKVIKEI